MFSLALLHALELISLASLLSGFTVNRFPEKFQIFPVPLRYYGFPNGMSLHPLAAIWPTGKQVSVPWALYLVFIHLILRSCSLRIGLHTFHHPLSSETPPKATSPLQPAKGEKWTCATLALDPGESGCRVWADPSPSPPASAAVLMALLQLLSSLLKGLGGEARRSPRRSRCLAFSQCRRPGWLLL